MTAHRHKDSLRGGSWLVSIRFGTAYLNIIMVIDTKKIMSIEPEEYRYKEAKRLFYLSRIDLTEQIIQKCREKGITSHGFSVLANVNATFAFKIFTKIDVDEDGNETRFPFIVPYEGMAALIDTLFDKSVHEMFFGQKCPAQVPKTISQIIKGLQSISDTERNSFLNQVNRIYNMNKFRGRLVKSENTHRLFLERLYEYSDDLFFHPKKVFRSPIQPIRLFLRSVTNEAGSYENTRSFATIETLMYLSMLMDMSLDQLIAVDYTTHCDLRLYGEDTIVEDEWIKEFVSQYLQIPAEDKEAVISLAMEQFFFVPMAQE